jgi:hypothetical protein
MVGGGECLLRREAFRAAAIAGSKVTKWVKSGKAQSEQILSALPPIADIRIARSPTAEDLEAAIVKAALAQGGSERRAAGR